MDLRRGTAGGARAGSGGRKARAPTLATSAWWKEERRGVFLDFNQNAKDRTVASAYSVRPKPDGRVSAPLTWSELEACEPSDFTVHTMPARFRRAGDPHARIDDWPCSLESLLELSRRQESEGLAEAPWPPHYGKASGEPLRAPPSTTHGKPLIEIGRAEREADAITAAEAWKAKHPTAAAHLEPADVLIDRTHGSS
jgi:bifunctional non-homologous end joining protein LigD